MVGPVVYSVASNFRFFLQLCGTSLLAAVVLDRGWWIGVLYLDLGKKVVLGNWGMGNHRDGLDFKPWGRLRLRLPWMRCWWSGSDAWYALVVVHQGKLKSENEHQG